MAMRDTAIGRFGAKEGPIPNSLLVVRGARFHTEAIMELLSSPFLDSAYHVPVAVGAHEAALWGDFKASLEPINHEHDPDAIQVIVEGKRVGFISRNLTEALRPLLGERTSELDCTIFWNGDPHADYQFYTVQLFS